MRNFIKFIKITGLSFVGGFKWYLVQIKRSKWYIIPMIIDIALIPIKLVIIPIMCLNKKGRKLLLALGREMEKDGG